MKLLINCVEQVQPHDTGRTDVVLYGRPSANPASRKEVVAQGFEPYFYAPANEAEARRQELLSMDSITEVSSDVEQSLEGEPVRRIGVPKPQDVPAARKFFDETWEADVPFTNRFRIDTGIRAYIEVPDEHFEGDRAEVPYEEIDYLEGGKGAVESGLPLGSEAEDGVP